MTENRSQGASAVMTVNCPWCDALAELRETELHCAACAVTVELAPDAPKPILAAAA